MSTAPLTKEEIHARRKKLFTILGILEGLNENINPPSYNGEMQAILRLSITYPQDRTEQDIINYFEAMIGDRLKECVVLCTHPIIKPEEVLSLYGQLNCLEDDL